MTTKTKTSSVTRIQTPQTDEVAARMHERKLQLDAILAEQDTDAKFLREAAKMAQGIQGGGKTFGFGPDGLVVEVTHREGGSYLPAKDFVRNLFVLGKRLLETFCPTGRIPVTQERVDGFAAIEFETKAEQTAQKQVLDAVKHSKESWAVKVVA